MCIVLCVQKKKTAGKGWDFLSQPEMTEEVKRDLELLQMRGVLNPKQRFKTNTMKVSVLLVLKYPQLTV